VLVACSALTAAAQVCGDADNNGTVTVTDGVQALRAAASLPSTCDGNGNCDVDGNGTVTVTDGVNILRKAADLPITEACIGSVDSQVENVLRSTVPIFGGLTKLVTPSGQVATSETFSCDNAGGTFEIDEQTGAIHFFDCDVEGINYDGFIEFDASTNTVAIELDFVDVATGESFSFSAELSSRQNGDNVVVAGPLDFSSSFAGDLSLNIEEVAVDPNGNLVAGSILFDASDADIAGVAAIRISFDGSTVNPVDVIAPDQSVQHFDFDSVSGTLTPVSG
jgi:hypothetical protein